MYRRTFFHAFLSGLLSTLAAIIYCRIYFFATEVDFSRLINPVSLLGLNMMVCFLAAILFWMIAGLFRTRGEKIFNLLFSLGSFACVSIPISISLPLEIKNPELFPGLAVPMVFFPPMAWFTIRPWFRYE